ncbi:hypothetical protein RM530_17240 [Algiphilus sp. W345]|uniref:Uncharacterized protein n=1 Tax=Banduia mediterranea TaxID=3075609 RepID=A0ABU2WMM7_9GAMM|nr:hypothetical protein [Algiphilus sp. W345]MDT0499091.1 hypothetical protein [Algiphilus sp. W345]
MNAHDPLPTASEPAPRVWSLELVLVILLPISAVIASFVTLALAIHSPSHDTPQRVDRFGHVIEDQPDK